MINVTSQKISKHLCYAIKVKIKPSLKTNYQSKYKNKGVKKLLLLQFSSFLLTLVLSSSNYLANILSVDSLCYVFIVQCIMHICFPAPDDIAFKMTNLYQVELTLHMLPSKGICE